MPSSRAKVLPESTYLHTHSKQVFQTERMILNNDGAPCTWMQERIETTPLCIETASAICASVTSDLSEGETLRIQVQHADDFGGRNGLFFQNSVFGEEIRRGLAHARNARSELIS